ANGKAQTQEPLAQRALLARDLGHPQRGPLARQLQQTRQELAALALAPDPPQPDQSRRQRLQVLAQEEARLARQLTQDSGLQAFAPWWVTPAALRQALPAEAVLVDFTRLGVFNFQATDHRHVWQPPRYLAWVTPGRGATRMLDLGPAAEIEALIAPLRRHVSTAATRAKEVGWPELEKAYRRLAQPLAARVLHPLLEALGDAQQVVLS